MSRPTNVLARLAMTEPKPVLLHLTVAEARLLSDGLFLLADYYHRTPTQTDIVSSYLHLLALVDAERNRVADAAVGAPGGI